LDLEDIGELKINVLENDNIIEGVRTYIDFVLQPYHSVFYACKIGGIDLSEYLTSFQARYRDGGSSYLSIVLAGASFINSLPAIGVSLLVEMGYVDNRTGKEVIRKPLIAVTYDAITFNRGAKSQSATLSGYGDFIHDIQAEIELSGVEYRRQNANNRAVRSALNFDLYPGDTALFNGDSLVVQTISYSVSKSRQFMECGGV